MLALRFLQFSDLHFESRDYEREWQCPEEKRKILEDEMKQVVEKIVTVAREYEVCAVLVAGDLFDGRTVSLEGVRFLQDCFRSAGDIQIFIVPGDQDCFGVSSLYNPELLKGIGMNPWPENVHIFKEGPSSSILLPGSDDIAITGIPHIGRGLRRERPLAVPIPKDATRLNVLLLHGAFEENGGSKAEATLCFNREEVHSQHFDYIAFGHFHQGEEIRDEEGKVRAASSGCPYGLRTEEFGEKSVIVSEIERGGIRPENIERIRVAPRTVREVKIHCNGLKRADSLRQRIEKGLHREKIEATDLVHIRIEGQGSHQLAWRVYEESIREGYFLARLDTSGLRQKFDLRRYTRGVDTELTTEGLFVRKMKELLDSTENLQQLRAVEKALEWGLEALAGKTIEFNHENQEI
ncbi:MAG: metallophosphoesterase [Deltaproteobacteria bacterium]|nr:metallophosphoesterase [Deltaproteobacteria bacterium]